MEWATASDTEASSLEGLIYTDLFGMSLGRSMIARAHAEGIMISVTGLLLGGGTLAFRVSILSDASLVLFFATWPPWCFSLVPP